MRIEDLKVGENYIIGIDELRGVAVLYTGENDVYNLHNFFCSKYGNLSIHEDTLKEAAIQEASRK